MKDFLKKRLLAFRYAFDGIEYVLHTQPNAWIHVFFTLFAFLTAAYLHLPTTDVAILILVIGIVWITEFLNTSIEVIVDFISPQNHPMAKIIKDISAGAVLLSAITSIIVGIMIFVPPILKLIGII